VEQAAAHLQVSTSSIRAYIREGRLKAFRVAGLRKVLIPRAELLALLEPARRPRPSGPQTSRPGGDADGQKPVQGPAADSWLTACLFAPLLVLSPPSASPPGQPVGSQNPEARQVLQP